MSAAIVRATSLLNEPGFKYTLHPWGEAIDGTPEQLRRIGIGLDIHFPERADCRWKRKCIDPRGFEVALGRWSRNDETFKAWVSFPGREFNDDVLTKPFAPDVELREETYADVYTGTADALVAAGIVPAGCFPGWPGMQKTTVNIKPNGTPERLHNQAKEPGGRYVEQSSKGQRPTYRVTVSLPWEIREERCQVEKWRRAAWECEMNALPRPAPLIDLPGFCASPKVKLVPKYRVEGNVISLAPRSEWRSAS